MRPRGMKLLPIPAEHGKPRGRGAENPLQKRKRRTRKGLGPPVYLGGAPSAGVGVGAGVGVEGASWRRLQPHSGGAGDVGGPQVGPRERALLAGWGPRGPLSGRAGFGAAPGGVRVGGIPPGRGFGVLPLPGFGGARLRVPAAALAGLRAGAGGSRGQAVLRGVPGGAGGAVPAQGVGAGHGHGLQLVQEPRQGPVPTPGGPILGPFGAAHDGLREGGEHVGKTGGKRDKNNRKMTWNGCRGMKGWAQGRGLGWVSFWGSQNDPVCPPGIGVQPRWESVKILGGGNWRTSELRWEWVDVGMWGDVGRNQLGTHTMGKWSGGNDPEFPWGGLVLGVGKGLTGGSLS